jgi:hypothetical protein
MNKRLSALVGAVLLSLFAVTSLSSAAAGDYAKGRGTTVQERFSFLAQGTGALDRANGSSTETITSTDPNITITGNVTCMVITGKDASIGGEITSVKPAGAAGAINFDRGFLISAEDNSKPSNGLDLYSYQTLPMPPTACSAATPFGNVITGDIAIVPGS